MHEYAGACRCGAVQLRLASERLPADFQPRSDAATCHFCRQHDGVWISDPKGTLYVRAGDATQVTRFASEQVQFHFCARCGELVYATFAEARGEREVAVVRVALFDAIFGAAQSPATTNFEGETVEAGKARRLARWTPLVTLPSPSLP